jgi:hypothetical protein
MRWTISHRANDPRGRATGGHDPRQIDFLAVVALLIVITSAYLDFTHDSRKPSNTAFIVPSQNVRW